MPKICKVQTDFTFEVFSNQADIDYLLARHLSFAGGALHSRAGFFAHQSCEKYLKAFLVFKSKTYLQTHQLVILAKECGKYSSIFLNSRIIERLKIFDAYDQVGRYGAAAKHDPQAKKTSHLEMRGVMVWEERYREWLDEIVFLVRSRLDYSTISYVDEIKAILERQKDTFLTSTWNLRPPAYVVLTKKNKYYKKR